MTCFTTFRIPSSHDSLAHSLPTVSSKRVRYNPVRFFPGACERRVLLIVGVCKHFLILTSSHLQVLSSSHFFVLTTFHLHIFSSSHLLKFTSSHLHIFSPLFIFTSSHLHICSFSHLHILTPSHLLIFTSSHSLLLSYPLALSLFSISLWKARGGANETPQNATPSHEMKFVRTK